MLLKALLTEETCFAWQGTHSLAMEEGSLCSPLGDPLSLFKLKYYNMSTMLIKDFLYLRPLTVTGYVDGIRQVFEVVNSTISKSSISVRNISLF